jgi:uncharacterized membrane protein
MRHSDIFDSYAKIAEEQGLVSLSEEEEKSQSDKPKESAKMKQYKKSPTPRMGSDTIEIIEALYGVKPDNSIEYENNIMESAHKTPVVIAPAYDRLNALVENNIERSNIMCDIALKQNDSNITHHRYAEKELLLQLVRVANDMDNSGNEDIRVLADACIEKLAFKKNADFWDEVKNKAKDWFGVGEGAVTGATVGGVVGGIIGAFFGSPLVGANIGAWAGGGIAGLVASVEKTAPHVVSISANAKDTVEQLNDLISKIPTAKQERTFLVSFQGILKSLSVAADKYSGMIAGIGKDNNKDTEESHKITDDLIKITDETEEYIEKFNENVKQNLYNEYDQHNKALDPIYSIIGTDIENVQKSIQSLETTIKQFDEVVGHLRQAAAPAVAQAQQSTAKPQANPESEDNERAQQLKKMVQEIGAPAGKEEQMEENIQQWIK